MEEPAEPLIRLCLAGAPALVMPGGRAHPLERRAAALLALVALEPGITRARLTQLLWPESAQPRQALRQQLLRFRRQFELVLLQGQEALQLAPGVRVEFGPADGPGQSPPDAELLAGLNFDDCEAFASWLEQQRQRQRQDAQRAAAQALATAESAGDLDGALAWALRLQRAEPESEQHARALMRLHYLHGDVALALRAATVLRQRLQQRYGTEPSAATRELERTLRQALPSEPLEPLEPREGMRSLQRLPAGRGGPGSLITDVPLAVRRPPRLVGRNAELARLAEVWQRAGAAVVVGEGGIGKTRLLDELYSQEGQLALRAPARPGDSTLPHALVSRIAREALRTLHEPLPRPLAQVLARLLPELGEPAPRGRAADQVRLFDAVRSLIARAAAAGARALLLDDLHHADTASLEALRHAAAVPCGLAWIITLRPSGRDGALGALIDTLCSLPDSQRLEPAPLAVAEVEELLTTLGTALPASAAQLAPPLVERTGGNPLYVLETVKALWRQAAAADASAALTLPRLSQMPGVAELVTQRLARLSPRALALARCAAVAGQDFSAELAVAVLNERAVDLADAWAELERGQIFAGSAFSHELVQEAATLTLPAPVAAALHAAVAEQLARATEPLPAAPARIAYHHQQAGHAGRAAPFWMAAGEAAQSALRFAEAAEAFERSALGHGSVGRNSAAFEAAFAMRQASFEVDLGERSAAALALLERFASSPEQQGRAHNERAVTLLHRGDVPGCEAAALAGLRALGAHDAPLLRAELRRSVAAVALWRQQTALALAELRAVQADVERLGDTGLRAEFAQSLAIVLDHGDEAAAAQAAHERAITLYLEVGQIPAAAQVAANLAVSHHDSGDLAQAWAALLRARALLAGLPGGQPSYSSLSLNSGFVLAGLGEYTQAMAHLDDAVAASRAQTPGWLPLPLAWRAQVWLHLGQHARAQQDLAQAVPTAQSPMVARARWNSVQGQLALALHGRFHPATRQARQGLEALLAELPEQGRRITRWRLQLARLALLEDDAAAIAAGLQLQPQLQGHGRSGLEIVLAGELAERLGLVGDAAAATRQAEVALALMARYQPDCTYRGHVWSQCLRALPERERRRAAQDEALAWIDHCTARTLQRPWRESFLGRNPANLALRERLALDHGD